MMIVRDAKTGMLKIVMSHDEFMDFYRRWQDEPETKAMFAKLAEERKERIKQIMAQIDAQKKR